MAASGIQQKITGRVKTPGSPFDVNHSLQTNIINTAIDDAVNAAIADERISAETLALQALGIATGDVMQRTPMMQTLTRYEREMEKQSFERQANQANAETRANRTQLTISTQNKATRNRNSTIDDYLTASTQTLLGQPIPDIELTERNLPSFDDPRWTHVAENKDTTRLSRWQPTKTSNAENKWVAFGKGFVEGMYDNVSGLMSNAPTPASMTQKMARIMLGENPIDVFINPTAIKNNLVAMYDDIHSTNPELKGYGWGNITFFGATAALPGGLIGDVERIGVFGGGSKIFTFDPNKIRFSQMTVSYLKQRVGVSSYTIDGLINSMIVDGWQGSAIDIIKMPEGGYTTIDNTRVLAARKAEINIQANVRKYNERLPEDMRRRFEHPTIQGAYAQTWGEAIEYRIMRQSLDFQNSTYPIGTYELPRITYNLKDLINL